MLAFLRRWLAPPTPPTPRLRALAEQVDSVEGDVVGLRMRVKKLEARVSNLQQAEEGAEDAPERTDGERPDTRRPPAPPTAELARRLRSW